MPKYTFSNREKIMLIFLLVIGAGLLWYRFVFVSVNDQVTQLQSEQQTAEDTIKIDQTRLQRKGQIEAALASYKERGIEPLKLPEYDNLKNVMAELRTVLSAASSYTLTFDDLYWTEQGLIARGASLSFQCGSYDEAKAILRNIYSGTYPSMIDSL
jgi:Tfp pilus assembly protein PilO